MSTEPTPHEASALYGLPLDTPRFTFRAVEWDGPAPARGDVIVTTEAAYVVTSVVRGAGIGHYRIETTRARLIAWDGDAPTRG